MPVFYLNVGSVRRSAGRSAIVAAAYCSRSRLRAEKRGHFVDFSMLGDVEHSEILLPRGAPGRWAEREALWNEVENIEKRENAQVALEIEAALPDGLTGESAVGLAREFVSMQFVEQGRAVDLNLQKGIGADGEERGFLYAVLSMREISGEGFGQKLDDWHGPKLLKQWRERWAQLSNKHLLAAGCGRTIGSGASAARGRGLDEFLGGECSAENFEIAWRNGERLVAEPELALAALTGRGPTFSREEMVDFLRRNTAGEDQFRMALARLECSVELVRLAGEERFSTRKLMCRDEAEDGAHAPGAGGGAEGTPTLGESLALWEAAGLRVRGVGLTYELAKKFEKRTGIKSVAVHGLLGRWRKKQELLAGNDVLVIDDVGKLSQKQKEWMLQAARAVRGKLALVEGEGVVVIDGARVGLDSRETAALGF